MQKEVEHNSFGLLLKLEKASDLPFKYYFLKLDQEIFEQMQITLSPKITEGNKIIVDLLAKKYNPTAIIFDSNLLGKLR